MLKKFLIFGSLIFISTSVYAYDNSTLSQEVNHQARINDVGMNILNANKIPKHIVFSYNKKEYKKTLNDPTLTRRQIIFYDNYFKYVENDDELAAFLSKEISRSFKSYSGSWGGFVGATQVKAAPKKYEIFSDKRAVDYMVKAGYNPLGLITYINKSAPQSVFDNMLFHNHPSKRMAIVYEYIYFNYPIYLKNNTYKNNKTYQNFLMHSIYNRQLLEEKVKTKSIKELKYE